MSSKASIPGIEWAVAQRPMAGQSVSGDFYLVEAFADGVLLAVIDGLGHGHEAAHASRLAATSLARAYPNHGLGALIKECHTTLRGSRGVALTVAVYRPGPGTLQWSSVGNVEGVLWHRPGQPDNQRLCVTPRGGVVGYQLPTPHVATLAVVGGDICCLATDGIASAFVERTPAYPEPQALADYILGRFGRSTDDALVLAVRFGGDGA